MRCPRCQQDNPSHAKFCLECGAPFKGVHESGAPAASHADLQRALTEAVDRETATSEILRVISQSPTEVQPVFEAIVRSGAALCHAPDVIILIADRGSLRIAASVGPVAASVRQSQLLQGGGLPLTRGSVSGRAFIDRRAVHVHDVGAMPDDEFPEGKMLQREYGGHGTTLAVPLLRENVSLGVIALLRNEVSPFTERQVALLQTFADQAVIAIENVRLFNRDERGTGTANGHQRDPASDLEFAGGHSARVRCHRGECGAALWRGQRARDPLRWTTLAPCGAPQRRSGATRCGEAGLPATSEPGGVEWPRDLDARRRSCARCQQGFGVHASRCHDDRLSQRSRRPDDP